MNRLFLNLYGVSAKHTSAGATYKSTLPDLAFAANQRAAPIATVIDTLGGTLHDSEELQTIEEYELHQEVEVPPTPATPFTGKSDSALMSHDYYPRFEISLESNTVHQGNAI